MEQLKSFFSDKKVHSILDVGCGTGNFIEVLKNVFSSAEMIGVDPNTESLLEARNRFQDVAFQEMTGEKLDFDDDSFDVASISMALHHLPDILQTLKEMQRIVKTGGWIIINELFSDNLSQAQTVSKQMHHLRSKVDRMLGVCHNETFQREEILQIIEKSGLKIELHFDNESELQSISQQEIGDRLTKIRSLVEQVQNQPEYPMLMDEVGEIEIALKKYGFQMPTRVVVVASVNK